MTTTEVRTSFGIIPIRGRIDSRFKVLAITGMLAPTSELQHFSQSMDPNYSGLVANLPGHGGPNINGNSVSIFAQAFDEVVNLLGPCVVVGISVSALVALSMRNSNVKRLVAVDPPLETAKMWQLGHLMRDTFSGREEFYKSVIGYDGKILDGHDYLDLIDNLPTQTDFVVGEFPPFPIRDTSKMLSMVDAPTRRLIQRSPNATLHIVPGVGHAIPRGRSEPALRKIVLAACKAAEDSSK